MATLIGTLGDDVLVGGPDDDLLIGGFGDDTLDGGAGIDTVSYEGDIRDITATLTTTGGSSSISDTQIVVTDRTISQTNFDRAEAGNIYYNVHSTTFGGGELRGQVGAIESDTRDVNGFGTVTFEPISLTGDQEVPARTTDAEGIAILVFEFSASGITYSTVVSIVGLPAAEITASHFHNAPAGSNGPVVENLISNGTLADNTEVDTFLNVEYLTGGLGNDTLTGNEFVNVLDGGMGDDTLNGNAGDDVLIGGGGNDTLNGGANFDLIDGGDGEDSIYGGSGSDILYGQGGVDTIYGEDGNDLLHGGDGNDFISGGLGNDTLNGDIGTDTLNGGDGDDVIDGGFDKDIVNGGAGNDTFIIDFIDELDVIDGGTGVDTLNVNSPFARSWNINLAAETYTGGPETESIVNVENLIGSFGNDIFTGNELDNVLEGGGGDDMLDGGDGNDRLFGQDGDDILMGGANNDFLFGGTGSDELYGGAQTDRLFGSDGNDFLYGEGNNDIMYGGGNVDRLFGGNGNDNINGGSNVDFLFGEANNDVIYGGNAADRIDGGSGNDTLYGGNRTGNDTSGDFFIFANNFGTDVIKDFQDGLDMIDFSNHTGINDFNDVLARASEDGTSLLIATNQNNTLIIENFSLAELDATDFVF